MKTPTTKNISELAFNIVHDSEGLEYYKLHKHIRTRGSEGFLQDIDKQTILDFLAVPDTKLQVVVDNSGNTVIIAHNVASNETIEITGLGDHFLALVKVVQQAKKKVKDLELDKSAKLLDHRFVKDVNQRLMYVRKDEVAIGKYREVFSDEFGRTYRVDVHVKNKNDEGVSVPSKCAILESSDKGNIQRKMTELINWVNTEAFRNGRDVMKDIAEFHSRFVQIHPFRDGNGRTARLLTNYLLLLNGRPLINIPSEQRERYIAYLDYSMAPDEITFRHENKFFKQIHAEIYEKQGLRTDANKYVPLRDFFEENLVRDKNPNQVISDVLNYESKGRFHADQIDFDVDGKDSM